MGCQYYNVGKSSIKFLEEDDTCPCLCTFPHNHEACGTPLTVEEVASLAFLGAAVCMVTEHKLHGYVYLPSDLPEWIVDSIWSHLKLKLDGPELQGPQENAQERPLDESGLGRSIPDEFFLPDRPPDPLSQSVIQYPEPEPPKDEEVRRAQRGAGDAMENILKDAMENARWYGLMQNHIVAM